MVEYNLRFSGTVKKVLSFFIWSKHLCYVLKTALQWRVKGFFLYYCWFSTPEVASDLIYIQFQLVKHCDANFLLVSKWYISKYWLIRREEEKLKTSFPRAKKNSTDNLANSSESVSAVDRSSWQRCISLLSLELNYLLQHEEGLFGTGSVRV